LSTNGVEMVTPIEVETDDRQRLIPV